MKKMRQDFVRNRKFHLLKSFIESNSNSSTWTNDVGDLDELRGNISSLFSPILPRVHTPDDEIFGVLLLICGLAAAVANALILLIALKHLRSRNVLFIIITNFALIDEFKALCAIYMGAVQLFPVAFMKLDQASVYKMLQISVFIFYFGNICSVLNLVLAVINEFLYIKLPLQYSKFVKKRRVVVAVFTIWLLGLAFSLSKALHGGSNETGAQVWISSSSPSSSWTLMNNNETSSSEDVSNLSVLSNNKTVKLGNGKVYRRQSAVVTDIYALILVSVLIFCLFIVGAIYLSLYRTIRRATCYRSDSDKRNNSDKKNNQQPGKISTDSLRRSGSDYASSYGSNEDRYSFRKKVKTRSRRFTHGTLSLEGFFSRTNNSTTITSLNNHYHHQKSAEQPMLSTGGSGSTGGCGRSTNFTVPSHCKHRRRDSRLFKRHKCVIVILSVCCLYLVYLSCYFALQLFHVIHIVQGIDQNKLRERYIINFILRALFVLHASLNPLIFFRIQTFRSSFLTFCHATVMCGKVGQTPRGGGQSFAEISVPIMEP